MSTHYFDFSDKQEKYFASDRKEMLKYIPRGTKKSLEFGCGNGNFSALVKKDFDAETWAVEINKNAADQASKRVDHVICSEAVSAMTQLEDGAFDSVILLDVIEHMADPCVFLERVKPKISAEGAIIASIPNIRYFTAFRDFVFHGNWDYKDHGIMDRTHLRFFTRKSIIKMFESKSYEILKIEGIHPTRSRTFRIANILTLGFFRDVRYKHFAVVARPIAEVS